MSEIRGCITRVIQVSLQERSFDVQTDDHRKVLRSKGRYALDKEIHKRSETLLRKTYREQYEGSPSKTPLPSTKN